MTPAAAARPRVDVGVVTWNTRDVTVEALRRLLATDTGADVRVLVRDHASADGTADAVAALGVDVDRAADNPGFAAGVNALLRRSDADWFLALNPDAWPTPGALGRLVATLERHPGAAVVSPALQRPDATPEPAGLPFPTVGGVARTLLSPQQPALPPTTEPVDWVVFAAPLFRRSALKDVGPLDESFHMYAEDLEWCWRARRRGWEVLVEPAATVVHVGNASGAQAYGDHRGAAVAASTDRFLRRTRGRPVALAYRGLAAAGAARQWAGARRAGDTGRAAYWARETRAQLRPVPSRAADAGGRS